MRTRSEPHNGSIFTAADSVVKWRYELQLAGYHTKHVTPVPSGIFFKCKVLKFFFNLCVTQAKLLKSIHF